MNLRAAALPLALLCAGGCSSASRELGSAAEAGADAFAHADASSDPDAGADEDAGADLDADAAGSRDARTRLDAGGDALPDGGCFVSTVGVYGECVTTTACAALGDHSSDPGYCPGPSSIECCTLTPSVADNPPVPSGWELMSQSDVTPAMTSWAVAILDAPTTYPMFSTAMMTFGTLMVLARVEWHPPDFQNSAVHRGVTLYQPV